MSCPADSIRTFLQLSRVPTTTETNPITANTYPFTINFGPTSVVPTFNKNMITDTQSDTLLYRGNRYQLINIQICQPTHKGYLNVNKTLIAEIALTYVNRTVSETYPEVILAIFPIYEGNLPDHNSYLNQFVDSNSKAVSAETLFYEREGDLNVPSYNYKCCFQLLKDVSSQTITVNTAISYFPRGTTLLPQSIQAFKNLMATANPKEANYGIMPFEFLPYERGGYRTYLSANNWDPNGGIPTLQVSPTDDIFTKRVQLMTQSPLKSTAPADKCPYKKVSDYKCYPFNELSNITNDASGNKVVIPLADAMSDPRGGGDNSNQGSMGWLSVILYIVVPIIILVGLVLMVGASLLFTNQMSNPGLPPTVGTASSIANKMNRAVAAATAIKK